MNNSIDRKQILREFLNNIAGLADEEYQQRVWIEVKGPECDDIDDTVDDFLEDEFILKKYKDFGITEHQHKLLIKLQVKVKDFAEKYSVFYPYKSTEKLVQIPEWQEIRNIAKEVIAAFNHKRTD